MINLDFDILIFSDDKYDICFQVLLRHQFRSGSEVTILDQILIVKKITAHNKPFASKLHISLRRHWPILLIKYYVVDYPSWVDRNHLFQHQHLLQVRAVSQRSSFVLCWQQLLSRSREKVLTPNWEQTVWKL